VSAVNSAVARRPGRPRFAADRGVLAATADVLSESGYAGFTIDRVAARAGVARATIYRRWSTKLDLVIALLRDLRVAFAVPDTGALETDLRGLFDCYRSDIATAGERVMAALASEAFNNPELSEALRAELIAPRRHQVAALFQRAIARGEVRADVDITLVVNVVWGFVWQRRFISVMGIDGEAADRFLAVLLNGIR
jgi:AcrR family transcriptional regulator